MKKITALALAIILSVSMFGLLTACGGGASDIESITVGENESNGVSMKIYRVTLKDSVDWAGISEGEREKIAIAGFNEAQKKIAEDGIFNYQIIGYNEAAPDAFMYNGEAHTMIIRVEGEKVGEVGVTVPER
jgi:hypothetical protein